MTRDAEDFRDAGSRNKSSKVSGRRKSLLNSVVELARCGVSTVSNFPEDSNLTDELSTTARASETILYLSSVREVKRARVSDKLDPVHWIDQVRPSG